MNFNLYRNIMALVFTAVVATSAEAIIWPDSGDAETHRFVCYQPTEISVPTNLVRWDARAFAPLKITFSETNAHTVATLFLKFGSLKRELVLQPLRMEGDPIYRAFAPDLAKELTDENIGEIFIKSFDLGPFRDGMPASTFDMLLKKRIEIYRQNPTRILAWNQLNEMMMSSQSPYQPLLQSGFTVFRGKSNVIIISGSVSHAAICIPEGQSKPTNMEVRDEFQKLINSSDARNYLNCEDFLR